MISISNYPVEPVRDGEKYVLVYCLDRIDRSADAAFPAECFSAVFGLHPLAKAALAVPFNLTPSMIFHRISPVKTSAGQFTLRQR
jgi:hypothetical protein